MVKPNTCKCRSGQSRGTTVPSPSCCNSTCDGLCGPELELYPRSCYLKCGRGDSGLGMLWDLVRDGNSQAPLQIYSIRIFSFQVMCTLTKVWEALFCVLSQWLRPLFPISQKQVRGHRVEKENTPHQRIELHRLDERMPFINIKYQQVINPCQE